MSLVTMAMSGLVGQAIGMLKLERLVGLVVDKVATDEAEDVVVKTAMSFVQPIVDQVEEFIKSTKTEIDDDLKPALARVFSVLSKVFSAVALDLSDVNPE